MADERLPLKGSASSGENSEPPSGARDAPIAKSMSFGPSYGAGQFWARRTACGMASAESYGVAQRLRETADVRLGPHGERQPGCGTIAA